eukprot:1246789-Prymnesium_polylepis.1
MGSMRNAGRAHVRLHVVGVVWITPDLIGSAPRVEAITSAHAEMNGGCGWEPDAAMEQVLSGLTCNA